MMQCYNYQHVSLMNSAFVLCICSDGTVRFCAQACGDSLHLSRSTHGPAGFAAVCALSEVLF